MTVTRFQQKRGTSAQWAASVAPLRDGELGIDKDTGVIKVGDGVTLWANLPTAFASQYLPVLGKAKDSYLFDGLQTSDFLRANGKAVDSDKLDGIDSTGFVLAGAIDQLSPTRKLTTYWGAVTAFPSGGVLSGDVCLRSDVGTNGSLWTYVGPGKGASGWVHKGQITCTAATRPATPLLYDGLHIYETDTKANCYYDGPASKWRIFDSVWQTYTPSLLNGLSVGTGGNAYNAGIYMRQGQKVSIRTAFVFGTTGYSGGTGNYQIGLPTGLACSVPGGKPAFEIELFMKTWNSLGNSSGFALLSDGSTAMQLFGVGSSTNTTFGLFSASYPSTGWGAGHNFFITGDYPIG